jgi:hypothetical protein
MLLTRGLSAIRVFFVKGVLSYAIFLACLFFGMFAFWHVASKDGDYSLEILILWKYGRIDKEWL